MEILILPTPKAAERLAARIVADRLRDKPDLVLGCATGATMEGIYAELVALHRDAGLSFARATTFNLDEYVGLPPDDERSYHHYMRRHLFDHVDLQPDNTHLPNGVATDLAAEARAYEAAIQLADGVDLQLLGLGRTGHIGFNEPLSALMSRTRQVALTPTTRSQNAPLFGGDPEAVPPYALTMGVGTILDSRELVMIVTGERKAEILATATEGPITSMVSATALQLHARCVVIADEAAASRLVGREHYRWEFENDPEWARYR
ncbi:MAG TPA: glucosamine-6-phosphate deaminase [Trueperaceae bacterium]